MPKQIETDPDVDIIITKMVESSLDEVEVVDWKCMKIESRYQHSFEPRNKQLPFDIHCSCIFEVPINFGKRFDSMKDGKH